ncbi:MAG: hypothetical protein JO089_00400 [Alphaproteobacteria bacterium]|nr:hypothetical protein [Alphaproteobacteria bacterium]
MAADAQAHGIAGNRFFPATLAVDDPAVADELTAPQIQEFKDADSGAWTRTTSAEYSKRVTRSFGVSFGETYIQQAGRGGQKEINGFDNVDVTAKYQFITNDAHELIVSAGLGWGIGGTGAERVGAERFSTLTPTLFFGKGFGDLPDSTPYLQPLAVTGSLGIGLPTQNYKNTVDADTGALSREAHPDLLNYGFTLQYSLPYLQQHVRDVGLTAPFNRLVPLVEFNFQTPFARGGSRTTGTINPGLIWAGTESQIGVEAVIPLNGDSGKGVGAVAQLHFYLDDIFPGSLGRPLLDVP